jgi:hypothetical protein
MPAPIGLSDNDIQYGAGRVNLREPGSALLITVREDIIDYTSKKNGTDLKALSFRVDPCSCRLRIGDPYLGEQ